MANGILYVDGRRVSFDGERNVLEVIRKVGIDLPTLCEQPELSIFGACRLCMVENERGKLKAACSMEPKDGLHIRTHSARLQKHRKMILELLLSAHNRDCTICGKNGNCRLQALARQFDIQSVRFQNDRPVLLADDSSPALVRDPNKCVLCGACVRACGELQGMEILNFADRGGNLRVTPAFERTLRETDCVSCGQCAAVCPTGALIIRDETALAWKALHDPNKRVVVQIAPAVRVAVGESFGGLPGKNVLRQLVAAWRLLGADAVYDTNFGADLTVLEESDEFLERLKSGDKLPMFTSCCPAWVQYVRTRHPELMPQVSSCKSPMEMLGAAIKEKFSKQDAEEGRTTYQIAVMPCTAKKMEAKRPEFCHGASPDIDLVLTTQEMVQMLQTAGIRLEELEGDAPDLPFGIGSGAAVIFGTTGGVAEAVARRLVPEKSVNMLENLRTSQLRAGESVRTVELSVEGRTVRIAVVHGLANIQQLLNEIEEGRYIFDLIEVMACQTGCVGGAGQPFGTLKEKRLRGQGLYEADRCSDVSYAEQNPLAAQWLGEQSNRVHTLLHVPESEI